LVLERQDVVDCIFGAPPVPAIEHETDIRLVDFGDQLLGFGHRVDERIAAARPQTLRADVFET
jgi:hypothetical protein